MATNNDLGVTRVRIPAVNKQVISALVAKKKVATNSRIPAADERPISALVAKGKKIATNSRIPAAKNKSLVH